MLIYLPVNKNSTPKMKALKITGAIVAILAIIIYFTSDFFLEKKLRTELSKLINKDSLSLYTYNFSNLNLNLVEGSIKLKGIKLHPTKAALDSIKSMDNNVRVLVEATSDEMKMEGFEIKHFLKTGQIQINRLIINTPELVYLFNNRKKASRNTITLDNVFSKKFSQANLKHFLITNASINAHNINNDKDIVVFEDVGFHLTNAHIDSLTIKRFSPFDYDNIEFSSKGLSLDLDEDFIISTGKLRFNAEENTTSISDLKIKPKYSQKNFSKKYNVQKTWFALTLEDLVVSNINFEQLIQNGDFRMGRLTLKKANLAIYKDKTKPEPPFKKKLMPASALKKIPFNLSIDTILVTNSTMTINEKSALSQKVSELTLNDLNATIHGFSNDPDKIGTNRYMVVNVSSKLMKTSPVLFQAKFDLTDPDDKHYIHGTVGKTDATVFNNLLEPMLLVKIKSGEIRHMDFSYTGDDHDCYGTMDFEYENFKVDIYNAEEHDKKQGLLSLAANTVIKSTNLKENGSYSKGVIKVERLPERFIFSYIWRAVQSGIVYTMAPVLSNVKKEEKAARKEARKN